MQQFFLRASRRSLKFTLCSASAQKPQPAHDSKTSLGGPGCTLMKPWFEGRTPALRPHHAVEVAEVVMSRTPCSEVVFHLGGLAAVKSYVNGIATKGPICSGPYAPKRM